MRGRTLFVLSLFLCSIFSPSLAQTYIVTDLGSLSPTGINSWAQVVGNYNGQAYIWAFGHRRSLGILPGGTFSQAAGINDLGVVVGTADGQGTVVSLESDWPSQQCSDLIQPFIWKPQLMQAVGTVGPSSDLDFIDPQIACESPFYGTAINKRGQIVGYTGVLPDAYQWAFTQSKTKEMSLLGCSFPANYAAGMSNTGEIVGASCYEATSWKDRTVSELMGLEAPGGFAAANDVNDLGQIVGWSQIEVGCCQNYVHAVFWAQNGVINDLGTLSGDNYTVATKINQFGIVIGSSGNTAPDILDDVPVNLIGRPFVWSQTNGMSDLDTLIPASSGWVLNTATDINFWGQIVGAGSLNGEPHGYLLTPKNPFQSH